MHFHHYPLSIVYVEKQLQKEESNEKNVFWFECRHVHVFVVFAHAPSLLRSTRSLYFQLFHVNFLSVHCDVIASSIVGKYIRFVWMCVCFLFLPIPRLNRITLKSTKARI